MNMAKDVAGGGGQGEELENPGAGTVELRC